MGSRDDSRGENTNTAFEVSQTGFDFCPRHGDGGDAVAGDDVLIVGYCEG